MTNVGRLLRAALPALTALALATGSALPARAQAVAAQPTRAAEWWLTALDVPAAWRAVPSKGHGVTVAVLSTGVDGSHPDLAGAVAAGPDFGRTGRKPGAPYWGAEGTAVASLIAGHGHGAGGAAGITGVAPGARILSVQVALEYDDPLNADPVVTRRLPGAIAAGISYAVGRGATVIALPLDPGTLGAAGDGDPAAAGGSAAERAAVSFALARNVLLIAPAGDNGAGTDSVNYPAGYPGVIAVGATGRNGGLAPFTNTRSYVALTAPGTGLTVAAPGGGYQTLASTDMAAALTAGAAALIRSRYPWLTVAEVRQALEHGTRGKAAGSAALPGRGHGALDAAAAVSAAAIIAADHPRVTRRPVPAAPPATPHPVIRAAAAPARPAAAVRTDPGSLLRSLVIDLLIAAGALIVALMGALLLAGFRRSRRFPRPAAMTQPAEGGSRARDSRPPAALPSAALPPAAAAWRDTAWRDTAAPSAGGRGDITVWLGNAFNPAGPARRQRQDEEPPWPPAAPPGAAALPPVTAPAPQPPPHPAGPSLPPWEHAPEGLAAPAGSEQPPWPVSATGPMYVWSPGTTTGPIPLQVSGDEEQ